MDNNKIKKIAIMALLLSMLAIGISDSITTSTGNNTTNIFYTCGNCTNGINGTNGSSNLGSSITFFFHDDNDTNITSFSSKQMRRTFDSSEPVEYTNVTNVQNGLTLLQNWTSSPMGLTFLPHGIHQIHIHVVKTSGNNRNDQIIYYCGRANTNGSGLQILGISEPSINLVSGLNEVDIDMMMSDQNLNLTDIMYVGIYVSQTGTGTTPDLSVQYDDLTDSRLTFPTSQIDLSSLISNVTNLQNGKVNKTGDTMTGDLTITSNKKMIFNSTLDNLYIHQADGIGIINETNNLEVMVGTGLTYFYYPNIQSKLRIYGSGDNINYTDITHDNTDGIISSGSGNIKLPSNNLDLNNNNLLNCGNCVYSDNDSSYANKISTQNTTTGHLVNVTYRNTKSVPMFVAITYTMSAISTTFIYCDANSNPTTQVDAASYIGNGYAQNSFFIVLPNYYYKISTAAGTPQATIAYWVEWY